MYCKTKEKFITEANMIHNNKYVYDNINYINNKTKIQIFCVSCNKYFWQTPDNHLRGKGCPYCYNLRRSQSKKRKLNKEVFIEKAIEVHGNIYNYDQVIYKNSKTKVKIFCNKCKKFFFQRPGNHLLGQGCPKCVNSFGEKMIKAWLVDNNINFIPQKRFADCFYKLQLSFDFYLPDYNMCIEFQGAQHYTPYLQIHKFKNLKKGILAFGEQRIRDNIKRHYCKNNNITLVEIKYDQNINKILEHNIKIKRGII